MRILHINTNYIHSRLHSELVNHLETQGVDNHVFVPTCSQYIPEWAKEDKVTVSNCFKKFDRYSYKHKHRKIWKALSTQYCLDDFSCIHAHTLFTDGNNAMKLSEKTGVPYIVAVRNTDVNTFFRLIPHLRPLGIKILKKAAAIIFLSTTYKEQVIKKYIPNEEREEILKKTHVIPNGINDYWLDNKYKKDADLLNETVKVLYVGRIDRNKNITSVQSALALLRSEGWKTALTIVGSIDDGIEFKKIIKDSFTHYIEQQPKETLISYYRENDLFAMPSHHESFGLVYAEAMSQGLPVIYTRGQGFDKQFEDGAIGYSVNSKNFREISFAIKKIMCNHKELSSKCFNYVDNFSWSRIATEYTSIYKTAEIHFNKPY